MLPYRLADRYERTDGRVHLTGIQALARISVEQLRMDRAQGLNTAALVSGYPGSPLGGFDLEMSRLLRQVTDLPIEHQPAVNEELGASAVMGSQLAASRPDAKYDGVVGFWYGKAPGLDRATDAIRHGVFAGTARASGAAARTRCRRCARRPKAITLLCRWNCSSRRTQRNRASIDCARRLAPK